MKTSPAAAPVSETRQFGKIVNFKDRLVYIVAPDSKPRRYTHLLEDGANPPEIGSLISFTAETIDGKKYGRATNVIVAIAPAPEVAIKTVKKKSPAQQPARSRKTSGTPGGRCGR